MTVEEYRKKLVEECKEAKKNGEETIEENCENWLTAELNPVLIKHIEKFGVEPECIGKIQTVEEFNEKIKEAIEKGVPYNEYEMLSDELKEIYDKGLLFFK